MDNSLCKLGAGAKCDDPELFNLPLGSEREPSPGAWSFDIEGRAVKEYYKGSIGYYNIGA